MKKGARIGLALSKLIIHPRAGDRGMFETKQPKKHLCGQCSHEFSAHRPLAIWDIRPTGPYGALRRYPLCACCVAENKRYGGHCPDPIHGGYHDWIYPVTVEPGEVGGWGR